LTWKEISFLAEGKSENLGGDEFDLVLAVDTKGNNLYLRQKR